MSDVELEKVYLFTVNSKYPSCINYFEQSDIACHMEHII